MRPSGWHPPIEPTSEEQAVMGRIKRAKLFVFLRNHRHELFDEEFQAQLGEIYHDSALGRPPVPPAQLALATILQAYTGVSDDEVIEATAMDRRWQLVLDRLNAQEPPFSKGTRSWAFAGYSSSTSWIGASSSARWRLLEGGVASGVGGCVRRWTHPLCGEQVGWRTLTTSWDTPSRKRWA